MNEDRVKYLVQKYFEKQGWKVKPEIAVGGINREVILDFWLYKEEAEPKIMWVECKGDESLSQLLEGFIRTEFAVFYGGGLGILAVPHEATQKLLKYSDFIKQAKEVIQLLDVETNTLHQL